jgi:hypothetical protein
MRRQQPWSRYGSPVLTDVAFTRGLPEAPGIDRRNVTVRGLRL